MKINTHSTNRLLGLDYVAVAIIVIAFFIISYSGFYIADDLSMAYGGTPLGTGMRVREISSFIDVFKLTWWWYFHIGGRFFTVAAQYFFCGLIGNKVWFDIANTLIFVLLLVVCASLVRNGKKGHVRYVLLFALLFWFFCPKPDETLFWVAGSTTHLWGNTLAFVLLWFFLKYKDANFRVIGKLGLFIISVFAATEFIPCASICGAFVIYYAFHIKNFKGNVVPFVVGFIIGSMLVLFAPGNYVRLATLGEPSFVDKMKELLSNPIQEIIKYKTLWMFLMVIVLGWIKNKMVVKSWMKDNTVLLLSLGWSVIAFSVVFRAVNRALFFPETISLVLFLRFLFDNYQIFEIRIHNKMMSDSLSFVRSAVLLLLFVIFIVDSAFAVTETKKQSKNNDILLEKISDSGGIVALDQMISSHRMAYVPIFPESIEEPLVARFGLDSVHVYPYYCQDKYYKLAPPLDNIYIDEINYDNDNDVFGKYVRLIVRIKTEELQVSDNHVTFIIDYIRPRKWYKSWLDNLRNYQYDRTSVVERDGSDVCFDGYSYYIIWFGRENVEGLKSVRYTK